MRERLVRATERVIEQQGVRGATVQLVLDEAGISRRTFYRVFRNLEDALVALFDDRVGRFAASMHEVVSATSDPLLKVRNAIDTYLDLQVSGGRVIIELQTEAARPESALGPRKDALVETIIRLFDTNVSRITGVDVDPMVYRGLVSGVEGLVHHLEQRGSFTANDAERVRAVFLPIFLRTLGITGSADSKLPRRRD